MFVIGEKRVCEWRSECFYGGSECLREKLVCEEGQ